MAENDTITLIQQQVAELQAQMGRMVTKQLHDDDDDDDSDPQITPYATTRIFKASEREAEFFPA
ncbi:hypothetical protein BGW41_006994, partial [Actinomortierella wolfii]